MVKFGDGQMLVGQDDASLQEDALRESAIDRRGSGFTCVFSSPFEILFFMLLNMRLVQDRAEA